MSQEFNGSSEYLSAAEAAVSGPPFTMACWFRKTGTASTSGETISLFNPSTFHLFDLLAGTGTTATVVALAIAGGGQSASTSTTFSSGQWHHAAGVFVSSNERHAYLNGGGKGSNTGSASPSGLNRMDIGHGPLEAFFEGDVAEVAIWNAALADEEIALLAKGFSPLCLLHRLTNLVLYQDLIRPLNRPGVGPSWTAVGGPTVATHPRIIYPWSLASGALGRQVQFLDFYRVSAAAAHSCAVQQGWSAVSGTELGSSYPVGEVSN